MISIIISVCNNVFFVFRVIFTECSQDLCPCGEACSNQAIQKHQFVPGLQKFVTKDRGFGVRTSKPIKAGKKVMFCDL